MRSVLNHIAILTNSIEEILDKNSHLNISGEIEEFPSEGTRELYLGKENQMGRLLLMQAIGDGPYKKALDKRGAGLHHIAIDVTNIDEFVSQLGGSGWMLHSKSLKFYNEQKLVFLCRSGTPTLIEVQERKELVTENFFIDRFEFPFNSKYLLDGLCCDRIIQGASIRALDATGHSIFQL